jgi:hypothetical protein
MARFPLIAAASLFLLGVNFPIRATEADALPRVLDARSHHLGLPDSPAEWRELDGLPPEGPMLAVNFNAHPNPRPATLFIHQRDVKLVWRVLLNGRKLGQLNLSEADLIVPLEIPPGALREGENTLSILSPGAVDDIFIEGLRLDPRPIAEALHDATLHVQVSEKGGAGGLPCRITIVNADGVLSPIFATPDQRLAVRPGVVYTGDGQATLGLPAGDYTVFATRGPEYGVDSRKVSLAAGQSAQIALEIAHEVRVPGWAACDTHIHTFTNSHHGDSTIDERVLTLAGEGLELAIASDHNFYTDLTEAARRVGVADRFTTVIGNEVTTKAGHFIAFPIARLDAPQPDFKLTDWPALMTSMHAIPGTQVVVLNHPRDIHDGFIPFAPANFNAVTGNNLRGPAFTFDAVEVANSGTLQSDFMQSYRDWFALLNHGYRITAVGSSDSHDVARFIVGQGRSYVACDDHDPAHIDVSTACRSFREGRVAVSLGLFTRLSVDDKFGPGDLATGLGPEIRVAVRVLGPTWVHADKVELFADGLKIREQTIQAPDSAVEKAAIEWRLPKPAHDVHLVAIAIGPGVTAPYWTIPSPYQPTDRLRAPRVIGSTNPVWIDADGDGHYTAPRAYAEALVQRTEADPVRLIPALASYDEAVAAQAAGLCQAGGHDVRANAFTMALQSATTATRRGFDAYRQTLPAP